MDKIRKLLTSPRSTAALLVIALLLFTVSGIGYTRSALNVTSEKFTSRVEMNDIGVSLLENGEPVSHRDYDSSKADGTWNAEVPGVLLAGMLGDGEKLVFEKKYPEEIAVQNTGTINEYVRVTIKRYWLDADGNKHTELSPKLIKLNMINTESWIEDKNAATTEMSVYYYSELLNSGETTPPLCDSIAIDNSVAKKVTQTKVGKVIRTTYDYDGVKFCLEATVNAVQENNAQDAILSSWGRAVTVQNGKLSLN